MKETAMLAQKSTYAQRQLSFLANRSSKNITDSHTEQLRNEIILAKAIKTAQLFDCGQTDDAYQKACEVLALTEPNGAPLHRLTRVLVSGIQRRCYSQTEFLGNLYSDRSSPIAMIKAYDLLAKSTPFIKFAYNACNLAIVAKASNTNRLHIIDIGIGSGNQWSELFSILQGTSFFPKKIHITGIDIPGTERGLEAVRERLSKEARLVGIDFSFTAIAAKAEEMSFADIGVQWSEFLVVNAVLALHYTPAGDAIQNAAHSRLALLKQIKSLNPQLVLMVEPDANHNHAVFDERCHEALQHYIHIFNAFEYLFPRHLRERTILENEFFGKEIINILTASGSDRVERHERKEIWAKHMQDAGFTQAERIFERTSRTLKNIVPTAEPFQISTNRQGISLSFNNASLLAASCWRPANS
ncbi:GRAS family protein [Undibacterium sp. SXout20W]|uniref:GRAS family protein n=1 Tax=Undibacterium sp. SXout20W TaxID=3413051 RepID=UPI003BF1510D